jgi:hypothetical protein
MSTAGAVLAVGLLLVAQAASLPRRYAERPAPRPAGVDSLANLVGGRAAASDVLLVIGDGQRVGYHLGHPTIAVPAQSFTALSWDEARLREIARRYGARLLVVSRSADASAAKEFAARLGRGERPDWLVLVGTTSSASVYAIR